MRDVVRRRSGSGVGEATLAVLSQLARSRSACATIVIFALAPLAIEPSLQTIGCASSRSRSDVRDETILTGAENVSVTVGLDAVAGPWLVTVIV